MPLLTDALTRYATHYMHVLDKANSLFREGGQHTREGGNLFDIDWGNIEKGQRWASKIKMDYARDLCKKYPEVGINILTMKLHPKQWINWLQDALETARQTRDIRSIGIVLGNLALAYAELGLYKKAIQFYKDAIRVDQKIDSLKAEGVDVGNLAIVYFEMGQVRRSITFFEHAMNIAEKVNDQWSMGVHLGNLGNADAYLGELENAAYYYKCALRISG